MKCISLRKVIIGLLIFYGCSGHTTEPTSKILNDEATRNIAHEALKFCRQKNYNEKFCILIDMKIHSGLKRFFIWDFDKDTITKSFLVGHGCCDNPWSSDYSKESPLFSNKDGSHCSSLGRYKIGERGVSEWGVKVKYQLYGLDPTNSNANKRAIVFHSWDMVSDEETYPIGCPEGWGCPTISNNSFKEIDPVIIASKKPVLMWIYK